MTEVLRGTPVGAERSHEPDEIESAINTLIERRAEARCDADEEEASYMASVREYNAAKTEALAHAWRSYYLRLSRSHARISERFAERARSV